MFAQIRQLYLAALIVGTAACQVPYDDSSEPSTERTGTQVGQLFYPNTVSAYAGVEQGGWFTAGLWRNASTGNIPIPLCWGDHSTIPASEYEPLRAFTRKVINESWLAATNIPVTSVWGSNGLGPDCPTNQSSNVRHVAIKLGEWGGGGGKTSLGTSALSTAAQRAAPNFYATGGANFVGFSFGPSTVWNTNDAERANLRGLILHEFGHLLGFNHEHYRTDRVDECPNQVNPPSVPGTLLTSKYDAQSIMDGTGYCQFQQWLSPGDIFGVRRVYGLPPARTTMPCRTAPPHTSGGVIPTLRADLTALWHESNEWTTATTWPAGGTSFLFPQVWSQRKSYWDPTAHAVAGDFNGDGRADVAMVWNDNSYNTITVRTSSGTSFAESDWATRSLGYVHTTQWLAGDFDLDGYDDLMAIWNDAGFSTFTFYKSNGNGFNFPVHWAIKQGGWLDVGQVNWFTADMTGDGRADVVAVWNQGGSNTITVRASTGTGLTHSHWAVQWLGFVPSTRWLAGDFNNDNKTDIVAIWNDGGYNSFTVFPGTNSGVLWPSHWSLQAGGWNDSTRWLSGDFNGDGRDDVAAVWNSGGNTAITLRRSILVAGSGSTLVPTFSHDAALANQGAWLDSSHWCSGDFY